MDSKRIFICSLYEGGPREILYQNKLTKERGRKLMEHILRIEGMSCGHCKIAVEKALRNIQGVATVTVDLEKKQAKIAGNVNREVLVQAIEEVGYSVVD